MEFKQFDDAVKDAVIPATDKGTFCMNDCECMKMKKKCCKKYKKSRPCRSCPKY